MKTTFTTALCVAFVGLSALSQSAVAQQKTVKQCNDEWTADKAAIQASGKTKRVFVAECRGVPLPAPAAAAAGKGAICDRGRSQGQLPDRYRGLGEFAVQGLSPQQQPKLRADQAGRLHV